MQLVIRLVADGTLIVLVLIAAPLLLYALHHRRWRDLPVVIMAGLTSLFIGKLLSLVYQPAVARPFLELGVEPGAAYINNPGFPSDHALLAAAATIAVYAVVRNRLIVVSMTILLLLMSVGRVVALVHTPVDIVGGILAGIAGAFWYKKLTKSKKSTTISV